ncbi:hypothetical protein [Paradevosia shaoguanensis]|uniref:hypothetical protein n=1 Tax=Paradevosia shaoguanensis TaxID=1335043 RepID=UPI003C718F73
MGPIIKSLAIAAATTLALASPVFAEGNLAANGTNLPELKIDTEKLAFSETEYQLETGKYYRLDITSDGGEEMALVFPELVRNSWINQIVVNDLEVKAGGLYSLEFDDGGTFNISFVPVRPGEYDFWVPGYENKGLKGKFIVK